MPNEPSMGDTNCAGATGLADIPAVALENGILWELPRMGVATDASEK